MLKLLMFVVIVVHYSFGTIYYVLASGVGSNNGTDWANANCKIPTLAAGDVVYIGNSGGNLADTTTPCAGEASHVFTGNGTSGSHITIKAATVADHGTATGWSNSFGVDVTPKITWSNTFQAGDGLKSPFWDFCGSYYDIDGKVGTGDTIGTYGFYFKSSGRMYGFIRMIPSQCSGTPSLTNVAIQHVEIDGVEANSTSCTTGSCIAPHMGAGGIDFGEDSASATVQNLTLMNDFIHDVALPTGSSGNAIGVTIANSYIETNFSCGGSPVACNQHGEGISIQRNSSTGIGLNNLDVHNTVWKNIQGTGFIVCLNGNCDGWTIYNNIFYYSSDWNSVCQHNNTAASCGVSLGVGDNNNANQITNGVFYGNTFSNIHLFDSGQGGGDNAGFTITGTGSTGNTIKNNLFWNCTSGNITTQTNVTHDYNTWLNTGNGATTVATHEFQTGTAPGGAALNPFLSATNFHLSSETVDAHLNDGISLSAPYNADFDGVTRGSDGMWERGVYEFVPVPSSAPALGMFARMDSN